MALGSGGSNTRPDMLVRILGIENMRVRAARAGVSSHALRAYAEKLKADYPEVIEHYAGGQLAALTNPDLRAAMLETTAMRLAIDELSSGRACPGNYHGARPDPEPEPDPYAPDETDDGDEF